MDSCLHNVPSWGAVWLCCGGVGGVWFQGGGAWAWMAPPVSVQAEWERATAMVFQSYMGADLRWTQTEPMILSSGLVLFCRRLLVAKREMEIFTECLSIMGRWIRKMKSSVSKPKVKTHAPLSVSKWNMGNYPPRQYLCVMIYSIWMCLSCEVHSCFQPT